MYKFKTDILNGSLIALYLMIPSMAIAIDQEYLDAVKTDYAEFSTGIFNAPENSSWLPTGKQGSVDGTDTLESFNDFLLKRFPGTYILYSKLNDAQKKEVWQDYVKTGDLGAIRSNIFSMRRKSNR